MIQINPYAVKQLRDRADAFMTASLYLEQAEHYFIRGTEFEHILIAANQSEDRNVFVIPVKEET